MNEAKLCILNSCFNETENNFTSVSTPGKAVVDFICVPHDVMENCVSFKVRTARSIIEDGNLSGLLGERSKAPDHSALIAEFQTSHICADNYDAHNEEASDRQRYKLKAIPRDFLSSNISRLALQDIISKTESFRKAQSEIDSIYSSLCDTIIMEMDNCIPRCDTSKKTRKRFKTHKPYWNDQLKDLWNAMYAKEKRFVFLFQWQSLF